ncbi:MAG: hypothetical protein IPO10_18545 [Flavobacteriales bacterium]|nr:hypothetical protein [Flavobacteriales bacterium]
MAVPNTELIEWKLRYSIIDKEYRQGSDIELGITSNYVAEQRRGILPELDYAPPPDLIILWVFRLVQHESPE